MVQFNLGRRTALVTGASAGLGARFSAVLAEAGATVILRARRRDGLEDVAAGIRTDVRQCETVVIDVADAESVASLKSLLGSVDILVNNAGLVRESPAMEMTEADWDVVIDTNLSTSGRISGKGYKTRQLSRGSRDAEK